MPMALSISLLRIISSNLREICFSLSALTLSILDPLLQGISPPTPVQGQWPQCCEEDTAAAAARPWREPAIFMAAIGTPGRVLLVCFSKNIILWVLGPLWVVFPVPVEVWEKPFSSWQSWPPNRAQGTAGSEPPCRLEGSWPALLRLLCAAVC